MSTKIEEVDATSGVEVSLAETTISGDEEAKDTTTDDDKADEDNKSALRDNIERKGTNAYYFAHANTAQGPEWDGKAEPRLLKRESSSGIGGRPASASAFDHTKSNITSYAFLDDGGPKLKIYVELPGANKDSVSLDFTSTSFCLLIKNYVAPSLPINETDAQNATDQTPTLSSPLATPEDRCLSFGKLYGSIESASFKVKKERIILFLNKTPLDTTMDDDDENDDQGDQEEESDKPAEDHPVPKEPKLKFATWPKITS